MKCSPWGGTQSEWTRWARAECLCKWAVREKIQRKWDWVAEGLNWAQSHEKIFQPIFFWISFSREWPYLYWVNTFINLKSKMYTEGLILKFKIPQHPPQRQKWGIYEWEWANVWQSLKLGDMYIWGFIVLFYFRACLKFSIIFLKVETCNL